MQADELELLLLIFARTLTISDRGYPLPDSLYQPDNQQDICARIFCFCLLVFLLQLNKESIVSRISKLSSL